MSDEDQAEPAAVDPLEVACRHARGILAALVVVDRQRPDCEPLTRQARAGIDVVLLAVSEIRNYRPIK